MLIVIGIAFIAQFWLAINPLDGDFTIIGFISSTGIIFIFIFIWLGRLAYNKYVGRSSGPRDVQEVLMEYFNASDAHINKVLIATEQSV